MIPRTQLAALALVAIIAACSAHSRTVQLPDCWASEDFERGEKVEGRLIALFSPDGPILFSNLCQNRELYGLFEDRALEDRIVNLMRNFSTGDWLGGQAYLVDVKGRIGDHRGNGMFELIVEDINVRSRTKHLGSDR